MIIMRTFQFKFSLLFFFFFLLYCEETIVRTIEKNHEESESVREKKERAEKSDASREKKTKLFGGVEERSRGG